jgi:hypothetical protein
MGLRAQPKIKAKLNYGRVEPCLTTAEPNPMYVWTFDGEQRSLSSANTTKPDHIGQAFKVGDNHTEFLSRLIYFGLLLVARRTRFQIHSRSTLTADVTFTSLRRNRN